MAGLDLNADTAADFVARINQIESSEQRLWGKMEPAQMLAHLDFMFQVSLGQAPIKAIYIPIAGTLFYVLFFRVFTTWPKGAFKAPKKFFPQPAHEGHDPLEQQRQACLDNLQRFVQALTQNPKARAPHPFLGQITLQRWSRIHGTHIDHHLRQFSV